MILIRRGEEGALELVGSLSDEAEIRCILELAQEGHCDPWQELDRRRQRQAREEEAFAEFAEALVSRAECPLRLQAQVAQWFRSRWDLERYRHTEAEARSVITAFAFKLYCEDSSRQEFMLIAPQAEVRVRILEVADTKGAQRNAS
ncbi:MAG: hypothetical protein RJB38_819 [Pseudomonadota bacterium]